MHSVGPSGPVSVVVSGGEAVRGALAELFAAWGWIVLAAVDDDLAGVAALRRTRADLLVVHDSARGSFGSLGPARQALAPRAIVRLVDRPQDLTADPHATLLGAPATHLRDRLLAAVEEAQACPSG